MAYYRLSYREGGRSGASEEFEALDDIQAVQEASRRSQGEPAELWCARRKVTNLPSGRAGS
ncbi:MAG TPA: hypothetical protein VF589_09875 [Allosphingosinicella sp.]|jgi:hypothetical protein